MKVSSPNYTNDFKDAISKARGKGAYAIIEDHTNYTYVVVKSQQRHLGRFVFDKDDDKAILTKKHIIEREYYPLELAIYSLTKFYKNKKIKYILLEDERPEPEFS